MTQAKSLAERNAFVESAAYAAVMTKARHPWHLKAWLKRLEKTQAQLANELDMNKAKVSLLVSEKQQYSQEDITILSEFLGLAPYELLMHPDEAMALRRFRASASALAGGSVEEEIEDLFPDDEFADLRFPERKPEKAAGRKTGTHG